MAAWQFAGAGVLLCLSARRPITPNLHQRIGTEKYPL